MRHFLLPFLLAATAVAAEPELPGHSHQGHAFDEGPRQSLGLIAGTGAVHLPVTTDWSEGQAYFDQGLGQLHGFWYYEAERSFRQLAAKDPECAMAYWGMAMSNWENEKRAKGFIEKAKALMERASPQEQAYIKAQANFLDGQPEDLKKRKEELLRDLEDVVHGFPEDLEAKAFLIVRIWQFSEQGMPIGSHEAVDALLQQILVKAPMHPAHHYRIHLWDKRKAERALDSAAKLGFTAPAIAHMWHMPGHIYSKVHRYADAAWHQQASARVDHAHMEAEFLLPDQIHNYAHNNEWLARNWVHLGNGPAALEMAKALLANPRHPKLNSMEGKAHSYRYGRQRLIEVLEKFEYWEQVRVLAESEWLEPLESPEHEWPRLRLMGLAAFHLEMKDELDAVFADLDRLIERAEGLHEAAQTKAREEAAGKKPNEIEKLVKDAGKAPGRWIDQIKQVRGELEGCVAGRDAAVAALEKSPRPGYAKALQYMRLDDMEKADRLSKEAVEKQPGETLPLAARIEVLGRLGRDGEAAECFELLRGISSQVDLEARPFARLLPIAKRLGLPDDWRRETITPADFGDRPDLTTLGPIHWTPPPAPSFALPDQDGKVIRSEDQRGKPLLLVFYLGHGCLHCAEQLNALSDRFGDFREAGLPVLAISTDAVNELKHSQANYQADGGMFPFPLVADPAMNGFRAYGAHDDFENKALHGTFLIDPDGRILWSDVAADPFMDLDFLLKESKRLLPLHSLKAQQ